MTMFKYLITAIFVVNTLIITASAEVQWKLKPVQCSEYSIVKELMNNTGEIAIIGGIGKMSLDTSGLDSIVDSPVYFFYNSESGSFTIYEFNLQEDEVCVIQWGEGVNFDVQQYFE